MRLCVLVGTLLALAPERAEAADSQEIRAILQVHGGATCLTADALSSRIEAWLHDVPIPQRVTIDVRGSETDPRSARLHVIRDGRTRAHRAFEPGPARCEHFQAAVSLAIALSLKASMIDELSEPMPDDPQARALAWEFGAAAVATFGLLPGFAPGAELTLRRGLGEHLALRLGVLGAGRKGIALDEQQGSFDGLVVAARLDACARTQLGGPLHGALCIGVLGGAVWVAGSDLLLPTNDLVGLIALSNVAELSLQLSPHWTLAMDVSLTVLFSEVRIGLQDPTGAEVGGRSLANPALAVGLGPTYAFW